jgi:integrase
VITDRQVKKVIAEAPASGKKSIELKEASERGSGRLAMIVRPGAGGVTAEWYAVYYVAGARKMAKLGSYPLLGVAEARRTFAADWAPKIVAGEDPSAARRQAAAAGTFGDLCDAYVAHLERDGKRTASQVRRILDLAKKDIGKDKPAAKVTPADIVPHLESIHSRGSEVMAITARGYLRAAFSYGLKAEHDYTQKHADAGWGLTVNPAVAIPVNQSAASRVGNRFLSPAELRTLWLWMMDYRTESLMASAVLLRIATGQRSEEVLRITTASYERGKVMVHWDDTKNGMPHSIPLPRQAVAVLDAMAPNKHGLYFYHQHDPAKLAGQPSIQDAVRRFLELHPGFAPFTARDLRRTFKTLAGDAGISKEMRDRLQNHVEGGVSAKHYDRYGYLPERRAAMDKWADYLDRVIAGTVDSPGANVVPIRKEVAA